jgi:Flp pilus assembly protein TadD
MKTCQLALTAIRDCLPPDHPKKSALTAKGQNRLGDCLLLSGRTEEALQCYHLVVELAPEDSYPLFNRGRAHLALGKDEEAKADFTAASNLRFKQPTARKLALEALAGMP